MASPFVWLSRDDLERLGMPKLWRHALDIRWVSEGTARIVPQYKFLAYILEWWTPKQAAREIHHSASYIASLAREGVIPSVRAGRRVWVDPEATRVYFERDSRR